MFEPNTTSDRSTKASARSPWLFRLAVLVLVLILVVPLSYVVYRYQQQMRWIRDVEAGDGWLATRPIEASWLRASLGERNMRGFDDVWGVGLRSVTDSDLRRLRKHVNPSELTNLSLHITTLTEDGAAVMADFQNLRHLSLSGDLSLLQNQKLLSRLDNLETLVVFDTTFPERDLANLAALPKLRRLGLHHVEISPAHLQMLSQISQLEGVSLSDPSLGREELQLLAPLANLKHLGLTSKDLSDDALVHLASFPHLESLTLSSVHVTDAGVTSLTALRHLKQLDLERTNVTERGAELLREALPDCDISYDAFDLFNP